MLDSHNIKAFFFVYSSLFSNKPDLLEVYRYFRLNYFDNVDNFYIEFYKQLPIKNQLIKSFIKKNDKKIKERKKLFPHYSVEDLQFRFVRDFLIDPNQYKKAMFQMFNLKTLNQKVHTIYYF